MRALVTGCAGFIGSHLTESLLESGQEATGVDCFNENYGRRRKLRNLERCHEWDSFEFVPIDLARGDLQELVEECDTIFHLAAEPGVRTSWGRRFEAYLRNNVLATQHLLEAARESPEKRFVFASSSSIYGQAERFPTSETDIPRPFSPYGVTKLSAEHLCALYHANYGVNVVALRYFSVYGPRQRPDMAFDKFFRAAIADEPITVYGDGEQTRDFTFVGDIIAATGAAAVTGATGGTYNIGGGSQASVNDVLAVVSELSGRRVEVRYLARQHGDVRRTGADISRARADLGFEPQTALPEGLRAQFEWALGESPAGRVPG